MSGMHAWYPRDTGWRDRDRVAEIVDEHGPVGYAVLDQLTAMAKREGGKRANGTVKSGATSLAVALRVSVVTGGDRRRAAELVQAVIDHAVEIGWLEDYEAGTRTFTGRIAEFADDQARVKQRLRQAEYEDRKQASATVSKRQEPSGDVSDRREPSAKPDEVSRRRADVDQVFDAWRRSRVEQLGTRFGAVQLTAERRRLVAKQLRAFPVEDLVDAVRGWRHSPHHRGENDRHTVYSNLELLLRDAGKIEFFRDLEREHGATTGEDRDAALARLQAAEEERARAAGLIPDGREAS